MATWNCANTSRTEVASVIAAAASGDTINIPAGSSTWSSAISFSNKTLYVFGAGIGSTVITLTGTSGIGGNGFRMGDSASRVSSITFIIDGSSTNDTILYARGTGFRIDHCRFEASGGNSRIAIFMDGSTGAGIPHPTGLIDHNEFYNTKVLVHGNADLLASVIWNQATKIGNADQSGVVYVETNTFFRDNNTADIMDANYGGRFVFRYNTVTNGTVDVHSVQCLNARAGKSWEIYSNTFSQTNHALASSFAAIWPRGGTGVIYSNTITGTYDNAFVFDNVRSFTACASYPPGTGDGTSNWDANTPSMYGYPLRDQIGRGPDQTLYTGTGSSTLPTQGSEPAYIWANNVGGVATNSVLIHNTTSGVKPNGSANDIVSGRDYFSGVTLSGYSAYTYPYPTSSTASASFDVTYPIDILEEGWSGNLPALVDAVWIRRLEFVFNPDNWDGTKDFYPEIVATNPTASTQYIVIKNTATEATISTISLTASTTIATMVRGTTPITAFASGDTVYGIYASTATVALYTARIYPQLTNNTTLRLTEPLVNYTEGSTAFITDQIEILTTTGVVEFTAWSGIWKRNDADHVATSRRWRLETIIGKSAFSVNIEFGLWNVTLNQNVPASVITGYNPGQTAETVWVDFDSDPAWVDGHSYRWYWKELTTGLGTAKMYGARLHTYLIGWTQFTSRARISKGGGAAVPDVHETSRWPAETNTALFGRAWTEASGYMTTGATGTVEPLDAGSADSGTSGSTISNAQATFSDSLDLYVSADWTPTADNRYIELDTPVTAASSLHLDWALVAVQWNQTVAPPLPCPPSMTIDTECKTMAISMVCKTMTIECCIP